MMRQREIAFVVPSSASTSSLWLASSSEDASVSSLSASRIEIRDRLGLVDRFSRWRFLQRLLDEEVEARDAYEVVYAALRDSLVGNRGEGSVELSKGQRQEIHSLLVEFSGESSPTFGTANPSNESIFIPNLLHQLEKLLPDPEEDEDAAKGLWDTVMELHGREAVKLGQARGSREWYACCLMARVLIHFDFLSHGL